MCVTLWDAWLTNTYIYKGEARHPEHGYTHVLGYKNKPTAVGPNAMILHFQAAEPMGPKNAIEVGDQPTFLEDLAAAARANDVASLSVAVNLDLAEVDVVQIFEVGMYQVVMASRPGLIPEALELIDEDKRPPLNPKIFDW